MMSKPVLIALFLSTSQQLFANDGAFFARGNQLIPIMETDISVQKEILTIKKVDNEFIEVTVYYEFFNPGEGKTILVGFEALSPSGDVDGTPINGRHPYMDDFTVRLNDQGLHYKVAYVNDENYVKDGTVKSMSADDLDVSNTNNVDFYYVYHFKARFIEGLNVLTHTYRYRLSGSTNFAYDFEYVLTAANRWANKQIDDFTLILDMGEFEQFNITKSFFTDKKGWIINGVGKSTDIEGTEGLISADAAEFVVRKGTLLFQQKNFKPAGELFAYSPLIYGGDDYTHLPFSYHYQDYVSEPETDFQRKVLKNLPFARRGYVFNSKELQDFFEKQTWYMPDEYYLAEVSSLTETEKAWVEKWK